MRHQTSGTMPVSYWPWAVVSRRSDRRLYSSRGPRRLDETVCLRRVEEGELASEASRRPIISRTLQMRTSFVAKRFRRTAHRK
jgi:hypothetical protein